MKVTKVDYQGVADGGVWRPRVPTTICVLTIAKSRIRLLTYALCSLGSRSTCEGATYCVTAPTLDGEVETVRERLRLTKPEE